MKLAPQTLEFLTFIGEAMKTYAEATADHHLSIDEAAMLFKLWPSALTAFRGVKEIPAELSALNEEGRELLIGAVHSALKFEGPAAEVERFVEKLLSIANALFGAYEEAKRLFGQPLPVAD